EEHVELARIPRDLAEQGVDLVRLARVRCEGRRAAARLADAGRAVLESVWVEIDQEEPRALSCEHQGCRAADARGGAGDDTDLALQPHLSVPLSRPRGSPVLDTQQHFALN